MLDNIMWGILIYLWAYNALLWYDNRQIRLMSLELKLYTQKRREELNKLALERKEPSALLLHVTKTTMGLIERQEKYNRLFAPV